MSFDWNDSSNPDQPFGIAVRQGFQQHTGNNAEDGAGRSNAEGQRDDGCGSEAQVSAQQADSKLKILHQRSHCSIDTRGAGVVPTHRLRSLRASRDTWLAVLFV